jgi:hypothetical protein
MSLSAAPLAHPPSSVRLAVLLLTIWAAAMAQLLWHFEEQRLASSQRLMRFDASDLPSPPAAPAGAAKALSFVEGGCRCGASALAEIATLRRESPAVASFTFAESRAMAALGVSPLDATERARWQPHLPVTPAVALWDARDRLIYFGPVNVNMGCGGERSYLRMALQNLSRQQGPAAGFQSWDVVACTCPHMRAV